MGQHVGDAFDDDIFTSLEFMVDPDGDPATFDDVPDVVQNSWGIHEGFVGYFDCDTRWLEAVLTSKPPASCSPGRPATRAPTRARSARPPTTPPPG